MSALAFNYHIWAWHQANIWVCITWKQHPHTDSHCNFFSSQCVCTVSNEITICHFIHWNFQKKNWRQCYYYLFTTIVKHEIALVFCRSFATSFPIKKILKYNYIIICFILFYFVGQGGRFNWSEGQLRSWRAILHKVEWVWLDN